MSRMRLPLIHDVVHFARKQQKGEARSWIGLKGVAISVDCLLIDFCVRMARLIFLIFRVCWTSTSSLRPPIQKAKSSISKWREIITDISQKLPPGIPARVCIINFSGRGTLTLVLGYCDYNRNFNSESFILVRVGVLEWIVIRTRLSIFTLTFFGRSCLRHGSEKIR